MTDLERLFDSVINLLSEVRGNPIIWNVIDLNKILSIVEEEIEKEFKDAAWKQEEKQHD